MMCRAQPPLLAASYSASAQSCCVLSPWSCQQQQKGHQETQGENPLLSPQLVIVVCKGIQTDQNTLRCWGRVTCKNSHLLKMAGKSALPSGDGRPKDACKEDFCCPDQSYAWARVPWTSCTKTQSCFAGMCSQQFATHSGFGLLKCFSPKYHN